MFASDLYIQKENNLYFLKYLDKKIKCTDSDDFVADKNLELISFILEDLDKCGELKINKKSQLLIDTGMPLAYYIFSAQKLQIENEKNFKELCDYLLYFPIHDFSLIQIANGPPLENEEIKRLMPIRLALIEQVGEESFKEITSYSWGSYYYYMGGPREPNPDDEGKLFGPGIYTSDSNFSKSNLSKKLLKLFLETTKEEKACIICLFHSVQTNSIFLPITFIRNWVSKKEFTIAAMGLGGNILDLAGKEGTNKQHQEISRYFETFASLCRDYINASSPKISDEEKELFNKIEKGESKFIEFKETLSLDVRKQSDKSYQSKKESYIELAVLKTIAGFLNSEGGELFIGVNDQGKLLGIKNELDKLHKSSKDKMQLHLKNLIKENIGSSFNNFIITDLKNLGDQEIIHVICNKSDKEVFIKDKDFYIRSGPSTDKLEGKELLNYTKSRFD